MASDAEWASAYALQALSDLEAWELLLKADRCHRLHYLQMATEKLCKAYLVEQNGEENVRKTHGYIATVLPLIARNAVDLTRGRCRFNEWQFQAIKRLAREIQVLAPACHEEESRLDNSEYPWLDAQGQIQVPCRYAFPGIDEGARTVTDVLILLRAMGMRFAGYEARGQG